VVFTTPNRGFPVELHTFLPFVHWLPISVFHRVLRTLGNHALANVATLNPLDAAAFTALFPPERHTRLLNRGPLLFHSNLICVSSAAAI
jgi:hypothetical protein